MKAPDAARDPDSLSRIELISSYISSYPSLDEEGRAGLEAAFRRRGLPLPDMSERPRPIRPARPRRAGGTIDKQTLLSYILLIYTGTALFYSWYYLVERLARRDFRACTKHKIIQTGLSVFYVAADILILSLLAAGE
jgi:hypothetical protein